MFIKSVLTSLAFAICCLADEEVAATSVPKKYTDYSLNELAQLTLFERLKAYPWSVELASGGFILFYVLVYYIGAKYNQALVDKFINSIIDTLKEQFYQVGVTPSQLYAKDDNDHLTFYASGRLNIESMITKFSLQARSNCFLWSMEYFMSFFFGSVKAPTDVAVVEFQLDNEASQNYDDFIWAIVTKDKMNSYREDNYFLSLTKTAESAKLPIEFVYMSEVPEMNDILHHKKLNDILEKCKGFLKYIAITDQPSEKPLTLSELQPKKKIIVELAIPKSTVQREALTDLFSFLLNDYVDYVVAKATFRPELTRKCKKTREAELSKLKKVEEDAKKEELANKKVEDHRKMREKLSPEELRKLEKKQKEKRERRQMNKQKVRM